MAAAYLRRPACPANFAGCPACTLKGRRGKAVSWPAPPACPVLFQGPMFFRVYFRGAGVRQLAVIHYFVLNLPAVNFSGAISGRMAFSTMPFEK
jgi:hypothetical protein